MAELGLDSSHNLCVTSAKHDRFICKIGPGAVSHCPDCYHLVQATSMSCQPWSACFYVIPSTESDPFCHSSAQSPLVASQPSQQSQVLTRWSPSPSLTSEPSGLLASGSLSPLSPPWPQGFTGCSQPGMHVSRHLQGSLLQVLCSDVSQKGLPLYGRGNCLSLYRKYTAITSWVYPPFNF